MSRAMNKSLKILFGFFVVMISTFLFPPTAKAVCPVCTAVVVGGLGLSRFLGIDDTVSGIWVGGLLLSLSFWLTDWIRKKGWLKKLNDNLLLFITALTFYLITFIPMILTNFIGHPANKIWGIDKLIFGTAIGSVAFLLGFYLDKKQRKIYGKQFFQFQKVAFPVLLLIISSVALYLITK